MVSRLLVRTGLVLVMMGGITVMGDPLELAEYSIDCDSDRGLNISHKPTGKKVLEKGAFHKPVADVELADRKVVVKFKNGDELVIAPRAGSGFLQCTWTFHSPKNAGRDLGNIGLLTFIPSAFGAESVTVGTGGICKPGEGSYMFLVNAAIETRCGLVSAWLTSERGSGVVLTDKDGRVTARMDYGAFHVAPGKTERTDSLLVGYFEDTLEGLESYADEIAKHHDIQLPPQKSVYCTWYSGGASTETKLARNTDFAAKMLKDSGLDVMQIDDGWQLGVKKNGPKRNFTAHNPKGPYPSGMRKTADHVLDAGMLPGIWWMPFAGTAADPHYADKQDFFVKEADGRPLAYVRENARRIAKDWNYKYFKLDGLWTGMAPKLLYVNDAFREDDYGLQKRFDASITPVEAYRMGMEAVRDAAGGEVFILGCNLAQNMRTMGASYGLFDAMRVGPDNNARNWQSLVRGVFNSANRYFLHGRVWYNDPDPHYVREIVPISQARTLSSWVGLTGFLNTSSEQYDTLPAERLDLLKRTLPAHGLKARPVDYLEQRLARVWIVSDDRTPPVRHAIGLFNWEVENNRTVRIDRSLAAVDLDNAKTYVGFDFWRNEFLPEVRDRIRVDLAFNECRIWCLRERTDHPMVVSTSRHVTQGIVDLAEERWDAPSRVLSGESRVVASDPYELRVYTPNGEKPRAVKLVGNAKGATIKIVEGRHKAGARILIIASRSAVLKWSIEF